MVHLQRLLFWIIVVVALGGSSAAMAHAQLLSTNPEANALLATAPAMAQLQFNEPVTVLSLKLISPDGQQRDLAATGGEVVTVDLRGDLADGTHILSWRAVSADGHPISGSVVFSIGQSSATTLGSDADVSVAAATWLGRLLLYAAIFFGVGSAMFGAVVRLPPIIRRLAAAVTIAGPVIALSTLCLQGLDALGLPLSSALEAEVWSAALRTSYAGTIVAVCAAFIVAIASLRVRHRPTAIALALVAGLMAALAMTLSGHASSAEPPWLTRPLVFLHILGILFWAGALLPLLDLLKRKDAAADAALGTFSRLIPIAVAPVIVSGLGLAAIQMGPPGPSWWSAYAVILAVKAALLIGLFALAAWNRGWLTAPALGGDAVSRRRLRLSIRWEIAIVLTILAVVAGWRFTPPPRALATVASVAALEPIVVHLMEGEDMAMVTILPGRPGQVTVEVSLTNLEGEPIEAEAVSLAFSSPSLGIEPFRIEAKSGEGSWSVDNIALPVAGEWLLELTVRKDAFTQTRMSSAFEL